MATFVASRPELWAMLSVNLGLSEDTCRATATRVAMELASGYVGKDAMKHELTAAEFHTFRTRYMLDGQGAQEFFHRCVFASFDRKGTHSLDDDELDQFLDTFYKAGSIFEGDARLPPKEDLKLRLLEHSKGNLTFEEIRDVMRGAAMPHQGTQQPSSTNSNTAKSNKKPAAATASAAEDPSEPEETPEPAAPLKSEPEQTPETTKPSSSSTPASTMNDVSDQSANSQNKKSTGAARSRQRRNRSPGKRQTGRSKSPNNSGGNKQRAARSRSPGGTGRKGKGRSRSPTAKKQSSEQAPTDTDNNAIHNNGDEGSGEVRQRRPQRRPSRDGDAGAPPPPRRKKAPGGAGGGNNNNTKKQPLDQKKPAGSNNKANNNGKGKSKPKAQ